MKWHLGSAVSLRAIGAMARWRGQARHQVPEGAVQPKLSIVVKLSLGSWLLQRGNNQVLGLQGPGRERCLSLCFVCRS